MAAWASSRKPAPRSYYRDIRIAPIYEGTNGIQAASTWSGASSGMRGGEAVREHLARIGQEAGHHPALKALAGACAEVAEWMIGSGLDRRQARGQLSLHHDDGGGDLRQPDGAAAVTRGRGRGRRHSPFLKAKIATCRYYLEVMAPEALSLKGSAMAGADELYALDAEGLAA
jgi:hypothetical protein